MTNALTPGNGFQFMNPRIILPIIFFVLLAEIVGAVTGFLFRPGEWYGSIVKPSFNPPDWIFGPVWTTLFILIGIAGGLIWRPAPQSIAMQLWYAQLALNALWTCAFFYMQSPLLALFVIIGLIAAIAGFMHSARLINWMASWLFAPYLAWVGFAAVLNATIVYLN
jgi:translocator protein